MLPTSASVHAAPEPYNLSTDCPSHQISLTSALFIWSQRSNCDKTYRGHRWQTYCHHV